MFNTKKIITLIGFVLLLITTVTSFSAEKKETNEQPLVVMLDWLVNPDHAPLFVAQYQGFFEKQGLDVDIIAPANSADPLKMVAAKKADIAISYQPQFMLAVDRGLPLVRIATLVDTPLNALAVRGDSDITTIAELKGKKIAYTSGGVDDVMLLTMLENHGLSKSDVTMINVNYSLSQALLTKKVDAIVGIMRNVELIELRLSGEPARAFFPEENGMPIYDELIFVTNKKQLNDPRLAKFIAALNDATPYLINHPDAMWEKFAKQHPELNNALNKQAWTATMARFSLTPAALDNTRYQTMAEFLYQKKMIKSVPTLGDYAVELNY